MAWARRMDESLNPGENGEPGARLGRISPSGCKKRRPGTESGDGWRCSYSREADLKWDVTFILNCAGRFLNMTTPPSLFIHTHVCPIQKC
jgi:hypothetical protein